MSDLKLTPLLSPRSIAFVGASVRPNTPGNDMMRMIRRGGFTGVVHAINPGYRDVEDYPCVPRLADLPAVPDLAVLSVRNEKLEETLAEAIGVGARAAVIFASGHLDQDRDPPLNTRLAAMARAAGLPICGSNCMGFYNELDHVWICGFPSPRVPRTGSIAYIAHSGSAFGALAHNDPRLQFALAISPGQELTTTAADYIAYAADRPEINVIGLFIETARDPAGFRAALEKTAQRGVPVVALKVGRTEAAAHAALTHTGAMAGSDLAYEALFDRYGVVRVETLDELASTLLLFATGRKAGKGSVVALHDSGGEREMVIDLADRVGVTFAALTASTQRKIAAQLDPGLVPGNPLDAWGTGANFVQQFEACFQALIEDENAALGLFFVDIRDGSYLYDGFSTATEIVAKRTPKPMGLVTNYTQVRHDALARRLTECGVAVLDGSIHGLIAARGMLSHRDFLHRPADPPLVVTPRGVAAMKVFGGLTAGSALDEAASLALLSAWEIPVVEHAIVESEPEAMAAAQRIGLPVVLKTAMPGIAHKSEQGGVVLNLRDDEAVRTAYRDLSSRLGPRVLAARMAPKGVELALGMVRDPQFGPIITIAAGGVLVELLTDRRAALAPFGPHTARRLLDSLALRRLLDGYRGGPKVPMDELARIIAAFSVMAASLPEAVAEIDVNPLVCGAQIYAVDALIALRGRTADGPESTA